MTRARAEGKQYLNVAFTMEWAEASTETSPMTQMTKINNLLRYFIIVMILSYNLWLRNNSTIPYVGSAPRPDSHIYFIFADLYFSDSFD